MATTAQFTNIQKAAGILVCLGIERAAQVLAHLSYDEVQLLASQMAHTGRINGPLREELLGELQRRYASESFLESASGGLPFVQRLLAQIFGDERAALVLEQLAEQKTARPFSTLRSVDAHRILDLIASEHPSIIALVLYYLPREKAAVVMAGLADNVRHEVVMRLVSLQTPIPHMVARLEHLLAQRLSDATGEEDSDRDVGSVTGSRALVEILGRADPSVERRVYEFLQERDPALAEEVRKSMFVFEDIARLDPRDLQKVLREISSRDIALALKTAADELKELVFTNVSENVSKTIKEELEYIGSVRVSQVEEAQQKVVSTVRHMAEEGTISMRPADDEELV